MVAQKEKDLYLGDSFFKQNSLSPLKILNKEAPFKQKFSETIGNGSYHLHLKTYNIKLMFLDSWDALPKLCPK